MQSSLLDFWIEQIPNDARDVFARGNLPFEFRDFQIQVPVIHALHDFAFENFFQLFQIKNHARDGIRLSGDGNFERVIVAVPVWIVAFAKIALVLPRRERGIVIDMRSGELDFARQIDHISTIRANPSWMHSEPRPHTPCPSTQLCPAHSCGRMRAELQRREKQPVCSR